MGLLTNFLNRRFQKHEEERKREHENSRALANILMDRAADPSMSVDQQAAIYNHIGTLLPQSEKKSKKSKDGGNPLLGLFGHLLHLDHANSVQSQQQQQPASPLGDVVFGDRNRGVKVGEIGGAQEGTVTGPTVTTGQAPTVEAPPAQSAPLVLAPEELDRQNAAAPQAGIQDLISRIGSPQTSMTVYDPAPPVMDKKRRYGDMTNAQLRNLGEVDRFRQEQGIRAKFDAENDDRTRQLHEQDMRGRRAMQGERMQSMLGRLDYASQLKANQEHEMVKSNLLKAGVREDEAENEASNIVLEKYKSLAESRQASAGLHNAIAAALPQRLQMEAERVAQGWEGLGLRSFQIQNAAISGMNEAQRNQFAIDTKGAFEQLDQIEKELAVTFRPDAKQALQANRQQLIQQISTAATAAKQTMPNTSVPQSTVPRGPARSSGGNSRNPMGIRLN